MECVCIVSDFWCPALFDGVLQEFVKSAYHSKGVALEQRDLLLRSFAEAITRVVFPKPGEVLRLPVGTDTDMVFEHPATKQYTIEVVRGFSKPTSLRTPLPGRHGAGVVSP